jgi:hypothetical protein
VGWLPIVLRSSVLNRLRMVCYRRLIGCLQSSLLPVHAYIDMLECPKSLLGETKNGAQSVTGWYAARLIGLNQGLTKAREEVVGTMNTVRCNH